VLGAERSDVQRRAPVAVAHVDVSRLDLRDLAAGGRPVQPGVTLQLGFAGRELPERGFRENSSNCKERPGSALQAATASSINVRAAASNAAASAEPIETRAA
jgi:hypothetical protein